MGTSRYSRISRCLLGLVRPPPCIPFERPRDRFLLDWHGLLGRRIGLSGICRFSGRLFLWGGIRLGVAVVLGGFILHDTWYIIYISSPDRLVYP